MRVRLKALLKYHNSKVLHETLCLSDKALAAHESKRDGSEGVTELILEEGRGF